MKMFLVLLFLYLAHVSMGQGMQYGKGIIFVTSPSDFLCKAFQFKSAFASKPRVQLALHVNESKAYTYEAAVTWVEAVSTSGFTACVRASGPISGDRRISVQWLAYTTVPGGLSARQTLTLWTAGTKCIDVDFISAGKAFATLPYVYVTAVHSATRNKYDAASAWAEDVTKIGFKICLRELKNFDGVHTQITVNWLALATVPSGWAVGVESAVRFPNTAALTSATHYSFCQDVSFANEFYSTPVMITTARHFTDVSNPKAVSPKHNAITEWVEKVSTTQFTVCMKDIQPYGGHHDPVTVSYLAIGFLDPCLNVKCTHYATCKAYGPQDARCECPKSCPPFDDMQCGSDGKTYQNICFYQKYICETHKNVTIVHAGACYPFILHHGRVTLDLRTTEVKCRPVVYKTQNFMAGRIVHVQVTVNYHSSASSSFVHDAAVAWAEKINVNNFTICALKAGRNDRKTPDNGITFVDYMAYQGAPAGAVAGEITLTNWWQGTTCQTVALPKDKFSAPPNALVSSEHMVEGQSHDAATIWLENSSKNNFKVCLREMQNFDGLHQNVHVNWIAYDVLPKEMKAEKISLNFPNTYLPLVKDNFAYCQIGNLKGNYTVAPTLIATARHAFEIGNLLPEYNSISIWAEQITQKSFRLCLKELHAPNGYDPVQVTVLAIAV